MSDALPLLRVTRSWSKTSGATARIPVKLSRTKKERLLVELLPPDEDPADSLADDGEPTKKKTGRSSSRSVGEWTA